MPRRRPLHTCATSCLAIAQKACTEFQDLDGPLGSMAKRAIAFSNSFFSFVYSILYQWLALLFIIDDYILTVESKIQIIFPQSICLFNKIDALVCSAEVLPEQLEGVLTKVPSMLHQFPLLDWVLVHVISWLNFLLSILTHWGSTNTREKEIRVDVNYNDIYSCREESEDKAAVKALAKDGQSAPLENKANAERDHTEPSKPVHFEDIEKLQENGPLTMNHTEPVHDNGSAAESNNNKPSKDVPSEVIHLSVKRLHSWKSRIKALEEPLYAADSPMYSSYQSADSSPVSDCSQDDDIYPLSQTDEADPHTMNCTYKEMLERGKKEEDKMEEDNAHEEFPEAFVDEENNEMTSAAKKGP